MNAAFRVGARVRVPEVKDGSMLPLTLRREDLREHKGQVSLPGGRPEPDEIELRHRDAGRRSRRSAWTAQCRREVGQLHPVYIPVTHTYMHVHVAIGPDPGDLSADPGEVQEVRLSELDHLLEPERRRVERWTIRGRAVDVPLFPLAGWNIWGATAIALGELAARLEVAAAP